MRLIRRLHLYLGCFFSPLLIYFSISGAWQVFRFNDIPKREPSALRVFLHELSKPHQESVLPGQDPKKVHSQAFNIFAFLMAVGLVTTALLGIWMAWQLGKSRWLVGLCLFAGVILPLLLLSWT